MLGINTIKEMLNPSIIDLPLLPSAGDEIAFVCLSGLVIEGAIVEKVEYFCDEWNVFVRYIHIGWTECAVEMTGWVCMSEVL